MQEDFHSLCRLFNVKFRFYSNVKDRNEPMKSSVNVKFTNECSKNLTNHMQDRNELCTNIMIDVKPFKCHAISSEVSKIALTVIGGNYNMQMR